MKKYLLFLLLFTFIFSCSVKLTDVKKEKIDYVRSAIICDAKTTKFEILNENELAGFLNSDDHGQLFIEYNIKKTNKKRRIFIYRMLINGNSNYSITFDRKTFPFSECRNIKTRTKYIE